MAQIELTPGIPEIPTNVRVLRAKSSDKGSAVFIFENPVTEESGFNGMTMTDEEGSLLTRDVRVKFIDGKFYAFEAIYEMTSQPEWDRFLRFMERFSESNDMGMASKGNAAAE